MDLAKFFAGLRSRDSGVFGTTISQQQVNGVEGILHAFSEVGDGKMDSLAYALATAYHETGGRMVPVREGFATTDAGARAAVNKLAKARGPNSAVAKYAQPQPPHGHVYYGRGHVQLTWLDNGRGHVQLTWLDNYRRSTADAGTDLVKNPDAMLDPTISARVLVKGLRFYLDKGDLTGARRTVNVQDKASQIAGYHRAFVKALTDAGYSAKASTPTAVPPAPVAPFAPPQNTPVVPATPNVPKGPPAPAQGGFWAWFKSLFN